MKRKYVLMVLVALVLVGAVVVRAELPKITVDLPEYERPPELVRLDQNWTPAGAVHVIDSTSFVAPGKTLIMLLYVMNGEVCVNAAPASSAKASSVTCAWMVSSLELR